MAVNIKKKVNFDERANAEVEKRAEAKAAEAPAEPKEKKGPPKRAKKTEEYYKDKYPHFIPGSLVFDPSANKQKAKIKCIECDNEDREVYTSDLFQVKTCLNCSKKKRQAKRDANAAKKEAAEAAKTQPAEAPAAEAKSA